MGEMGEMEELEVFSRDSLILMRSFKYIWTWDYLKVYEVNLNKVSSKVLTGFVCFEYADVYLSFLTV